MYFESHAHYDDDVFNSDRTELINEMHKSGISHIINVGCNMASSQISMELAETYDFIYASVGIHPSDADMVTEQDYKLIAEYCSNPKVVALGEIGLDYHYEPHNKENQRKCFKRQLEIAKKANKPVIIHSREASLECFEIIKESKVRSGVVHAFSGSAEMAQEYIKMGFFIGVGGVVTFKNSRKLTEVVETIPLEKILIETDSPYLAPVPVRGSRNDSRNLRFVCEKIAQLKNIDIEKVKKVTTKNAKTLFNIKH